jgi:pyrophosphatase PpaX
MKDYDCYLFDIDGTLIDTTELIFKCFQKTCLQYAGYAPKIEFIAGMTGLPLNVLVERCLDGKCDYEMETVILEYKAFQKTIFKDHLKLFPNVNEVLGKLKKQGKKIAAVTSRRQESLKPYLIYTNTLQYFDVLVTPELTTHHKPHPMPAVRAIELLQTKPEKCLFVGDSKFDIQCGQSAGTDTAFVSWSFNQPDELKKPSTYLISSMEDLIID